MFKYLILTLLGALLLAGAAQGATPTGHWCDRGDPPLYASADTVCGLAGNVITEYVDVCHESRSCQIGVESSDSQRRYLVRCERSGSRDRGSVYCQGASDTGIWTRFSALV